MMRVKHIKDYMGGRALRGLLESHIGQLWNDVYSKICSFADSRSTLGRELRHRIKWYVDLGNYKYPDLYVDSNGILCKKEKKRINWRRPRPDEMEIDYILNPNVGEYIKINNGWFKVWIEEIKDTYPIDIILEENIKKPIRSKVVLYKRHVEHKVQLSKKDVRDIIIPNLLKGTNKKFMNRIGYYIPASKWNS